ncbi:3-alpha-(or 20-beta)-hydroxysteroid dehydrogenase [Rhodococcus erythropolis]|uniref:SDR family NAD(P)-dependent oxidoreductase n=1 Tax=Rhodococcus erythropolis TaxID=1833 RepID=UPI000BB35E68|nr:SDR family NAD(P)-dependent oxidoreductase [Rhodococcus erythropolis]PBI89421.1 3-alpha-(or 20-beta)-hydroxysteroid dehydrogenase [Rhodococcus erythropolis]
MGSMDGRTIIVTGGARGMGAATARRLAAEGGTVVIGDVLADEASALASEIEQSGGHAVSASLDVTSETDWERVTAVAGELGGADALVNNAGISQRVGILETERSHWDQVLAINLTGCMLGIRAVAPGMCDRGRGSIVNISSIAGLVAYSSAAYSASKWGVRGLTKVAALELGPSGVRANSVHPGIVETPMIENVDSAVRASFAATTPSKRTGQADEVAAVVAFLCSDASSYVNGAEVAVDGGFSAGGAFQGVINEVTRRSNEAIR